MTDYVNVNHENIGGIPQRQAGGPLERFISLFGFELDGAQSEYEALLHVNDVLSIPASTLPYVANDLGFPYEGSLGDTSVRRLLDQLLRLRKLKGTRPGLAGFVTALTGYQSDALPGRNLLLTTDDSNFTAGLGGWTALTTADGYSDNTTVVRETGPTPGPHSGPPGSGYLSFRPTANSTGYYYFGVKSGATPIPQLKALRPGTYTASVWVKTPGPFPAYSGATAYTVGDCVTNGGVKYICVQSHSAGTHTPPDALWWQPVSSTFIDLGASYTNAQGVRVFGTGGSPLAANVPTASFDGTWKFLHYSFDPPDGAAFVRLVSRWLSPSSTDPSYVHNIVYLSDPALTYTEEVAGADLVFEPARMVHIYCAPERVNMLQNPSIQTSVGSGGLGNGEWTELAGSTGVLSYDFNHGVDGEGCLKARIDADASFMGVQAATDVAEPAEIGEVYTAQALVFCPPGVTVEIMLDFTDTDTGADVVMPATGEHYTTGVITPSPGTYLPLSVSGTADAERAILTVKFYGDNLQVAYVDRAMIEKCAQLCSYFDGDTLSTYGEYAWEDTQYDSASTFHLHRSIREAVLARHLPDWIPGDAAYDVTYTAAP